MIVYEVQVYKQNDWVTLWCCRMYREHYAAFLDFIHGRYKYLRDNWSNVRICVSENVLVSEVATEFDGIERIELDRGYTDTDASDYEFKPDTPYDEWDADEKDYKDIGGPKDINDADWWKKGSQDDD